MRVICINDSVLPKTLNPEYLGLIKVGEEYNANQSPFHKIGYMLEGFGNHSFLKERFAPLSEIDERELAHAEPIESTFKLITIEADSLQKVYDRLFPENKINV